MQRSSRLLALVALGGAVALAACGGSPDLSPVAATTTGSGDNAVLTSSGNGPGGQPSPAPGTGTCTNDCDGTSQGPGPGAGHGYGPGPANGGGTGSGYGPGPGPGDGFCGNACTGPVGPDPADIARCSAFALQEEYKAQYLYAERTRDIGPGDRAVCAIVESERRHVQALQMLFTRRQLAPPGRIDAARLPEPYATIPAACAAGVAAEIADAAFYDKYLPRTDLPQDVENVFTNLQSRLARQPPPGLPELRQLGDTNDPERPRQLPLAGLPPHGLRAALRAGGGVPPLVQLAARGIEASADSPMKDVAERHGQHPHDLVEILAGV